VELVVFVDAPEGRREIVRVLDQEPAGVLRQPCESGSRVELEHVLRSLAKAETLSGVLRDAARRGIQVEITARAAEAILAELAP
jgi:hypothetical protein